MKNISELIPDYISLKHNLFVKKLYETGDPKILNKFRLALAKDIKGFAFPIKIYTNYCFENKNDICFSTLLLKMKTNSMFMLLDRLGCIQSVDYPLFKKFFKNCTANKLNILYRCNLGLIMPEFLERALKIDENIDKLSILNDVKLDLFIPMRLDKTIQSFEDFMLKIFFVCFH